MFQGLPGMVPIVVVGQIVRRLVFEGVGTRRLSSSQRVVMTPLVRSLERRRKTNLIFPEWSGDRRDQFVIDRADHKHWGTL